MKLTIKLALITDVLNSFVPSLIRIQHLCH